MSDTPRLLLVEDDPVFAVMLTSFLGKNGFAVEHLASGLMVMDRVRAHRPDVIILDGNLPDADGTELCRELRPIYAGVIIMLTARDEAIDELLGLELGADDYIRKPALPRVVLARIRACLRRGGPVPADKTLTFGPLTVDPDSRTVTLDGQPLPLTTAEYELLWVLASQAGQVLSRDALFKATRGFEYDGLDRSIDMRISRLRKLLGDEAEPARRIKTVRGRGYLFPARWE
jgi:DNA-binding response OmpR family regulator